MPSLWDENVGRNVCYHGYHRYWRQTGSRRNIDGTADTDTTEDVYRLGGLHVHRTGQVRFDGKERAPFGDSKVSRVFLVLLLVSDGSGTVRQL